MTEQDFFDILSNKVQKTEFEFAKKILYDCQKNGFFIDWKQGSFVVKYYNPDLSSLDFSLFYLTKHGTINTGWTIGKLTKANINIDIRTNFTNSIVNLFENINVYKLESLKPEIKLSKLISKYEQFFNFVKLFANNIEDELIKKNNQ